jgi:hypothetical protein
VTETTDGLLQFLIGEFLADRVGNEVGILVVLIGFPGIDDVLDTHESFSLGSKLI